MVLHAQEHGIRAASRDFKASRNTVRKWLRRYEKYGYSGLIEESRRPHHSPIAVSEEKREELVKLKKNKYKRMGAEQIKYLENISLSPKTIRKIWRQEGVSSRKRRKKHETKRNLRKMKREWALFQQIEEDTKDMKDIPEYWIQTQKKSSLPTIQYTARDVTSGLMYLGFADERSLTYAALFAEYLNRNLQKYGADLSNTIRQTDNGSEFIGSWNAIAPSAYTIAIESVAGQQHLTIPPRAHRYQADIETVHNLIEMEFYEIEDFLGENDFIKKACSYQIFFNLLRPNSYKEFKTPWQIANEKHPELPVDIALIPAVDLRELLKKKLAFLSNVGHDVCTVPSVYAAGTFLLTFPGVLCIVILKIKIIFIGS
jgi:transposase